MYIIYLFCSSALLFLIVASESVQNNKFIGPDRNQITSEKDNASSVEESRNQFKSENKAKINFKIPSNLKRTKRYSYNVSKKIKYNYFITVI